MQIVTKASRKICRDIVVTDTGRRQANSCFYRYPVCVVSIAGPFVCLFVWVN